MRREVQSSAPWIRRIPTARLATAAACCCILIAAAIVVPAVLRSAPGYVASDEAAEAPQAVADGGDLMSAVAEEYGRDAMQDRANEITAGVEMPVPDAPAHVDFEEAEEESFGDASENDGAETANAALNGGEWVWEIPAFDSESEPPAVSDDASPPVSMEEWLLNFIHYFEYYDYQTYRDWDSGGIWDNLSGFPILEIPLILPEWVRNLPEDTVWDSPLSEYTFDTLGEAIAFFLSEEHRLAYIDYYYSYDEHDYDHHGGRVDFYGSDFTAAEPIYSMLSRNMNSRLVSNNSFYLGDISICILNESGFVILSIRPCNSLTLSSNGTFLKYKLEDGTFEKLLSYLIHIE
jgi:hypothetical protein